MARPGIKPGIPATLVRSFTVEQPMRYQRYIKPQVLHKDSIFILETCKFRVEIISFAPFYLLSLLFCKLTSKGRHVGCMTSKEIKSLDI